MLSDTIKDITTHPLPLKFIKIAKKNFYKLSLTETDHYFKKCPDSAPMNKKFPDDDNLDQIFCYLPIDKPIISDKKQINTEPFKLNEKSQIESNDIMKKNEIQPKQRISSINENRKRSISNGGLIKFLMFNETLNALSKLKVIFQKVFMSHFIATGICICKIALQSKISTYCWVSVCSCQDDLKMKLYSTISDFFMYWVLYIILASKSIIVLKEFHNKLVLKLFLYFIMTAFIWLYLMLVPEDKMNTVHCYVFLIFICFIFYSYYLYLIKFDLLLWIKIVLKINTLVVIVFLNHLLLRYYFIMFFDIIKDNMDNFWSKNIILVLIACYFKLFTYSTKELLYIYYKFIVTQHKKNSRTLISYSRYILCFCVCFNISGLLKMEVNDVGGWLLILLYAIFVFSAYINLNYVSFIVIKLKQLFNRKYNENRKKDEKTEKEKELIIKFERMFSGAMLDMILICTSKLMIWYIGGRWTLWYYTMKYYKDCDFSINIQEFKMTSIGFASIIIVNLSVTILILVYMVKKKIIFFEYKFRHYTFYNTYFLVLLHSFFEGMMQSVYSIS